MTDRRGAVNENGACVCKRQEEGLSPSNAEEKSRCLHISNRSPAKRLRFEKEETRSADEKKAGVFTFAFFEPCGVISDEIARFELAGSPLRGCPFIVTRSAREVASLKPTELEKDSTPRSYASVCVQVCETPRRRALKSADRRPRLTMFPQTFSVIILLTRMERST